MSKTLKHILEHLIDPDFDFETIETLDFPFNIEEFCRENDKLHDKIEQLEIDIKAYQRIEEIADNIIGDAEAGNLWRQWNKDSKTVWDNRHLYKYLEKTDESS